MQRSGCTTPPTGGLGVDDEAVTGGESLPLTLDPAGLPADVAASSTRTWRPTTRCGCDRATPGNGSAELLTGQVAVAAYDDLGRLRRRHRRADPGRARRRLRARHRRDARADLAPTARRRWRSGRRRRKDVALLRRPAGAGAEHAGRMRRDDRPASGRVPGAADLEGRAATLFEVDGLRAGDRDGRDQRRHRPVLGGPDARTPPARWSSTSTTRRWRPAGWAPAAPSRPRAAGGLDDLRAARPRLLDRRRDRAGRAPRHVPRVHRPEQRRHAAPARRSPTPG